MRYLSQREAGKLSLEQLMNVALITYGGPMSLGSIGTHGQTLEALSSQPTDRPVRLCDNLHLVLAAVDGLLCALLYWV